MKRVKSKKKYILRRDKPVFFKGRTLYPIVMLWGGGNFHVGELGGLIESESNLSHEGFSWVYPNAKVWGKARVEGDMCLINGEMGDEGNIGTSVTFAPSSKSEPDWWKRMRSDSWITEEEAISITL